MNVTEPITIVAPVDLVDEIEGDAAALEVETGARLERDGAEQRRGPGEVLLAAVALLGVADNLIGVGQFLADRVGRWRRRTHTDSVALTLLRPDGSAVDVTVSADDDGPAVVEALRKALAEE